MVSLTVCLLRGLLESVDNFKILKGWEFKDKRKLKGTS
jgi:hypothetical protein